MLVDSQLASEIAGIVFCVLSLLPGLGLSRRLSLRMEAAKRLRGRAPRRVLLTFLGPWLETPKAAVWKERKLGWQQCFGGKVGGERELSTTLVIKAPLSGGEKGVLYCSFEFNWMSILASGSAPDLLRKYLLVGASSDSPVDYFVFASFIGISDDPLFIGVSHLDDLEHYGPFRPTVQPLPLMACDWVDPHKFTPRSDADRDIDILMVSNWSQRKRHWLLFNALRKLRSNLRVILVGRNALGRTADDVIEEARAFGVKQNIEFLTNIPFEQVTELMCRAKVFLALSRREGACVAVSESMFADTPVVMMADAHVGASAHINEFTGAVATRESLSRITAELIEKRSALRPRTWATQHISAQVSSSRLNETLKSYCSRRGLPWTVDIAPLCWDYVPTYLEPDDNARLSAATRDFEEEYKLKLLRFRYNAAREKPSIRALAEQR